MIYYHYRGDYMKKSYKGFFLWLALFLFGFYPLLLISGDNGNTATKLTLLYTTLMVAGLMIIIERTDKVYWINGVTFEEAEKAGYEKRMEFAAAHTRKFNAFAVIHTVFTVISFIFNLSIWLDIIVMLVGLIVTAFSTINIRLE